MSHANEISLSPDKERLFAKAFVLLSLALHLAIFIDLASTGSASSQPIALGYSARKLLMLGAYGVFLGCHIGVLAHRHRQLLLRRLVFGLTVASILYGGLESILRFHGLGLLTPSKMRRLNYKWHAANTRFTFIGQIPFAPHEFSVTVRNNGKGYNDSEHNCGPSTDRRFRVLLMGDSFVEAFQVEQHQALHALLQRDLDASMNRTVETIAIGRSGTGALWQLDKMLDESVACYQPDVVLSQYAHWFVDRDKAVMDLRTQSGRFNQEKVNRRRAARGTVSYQQRLFMNPITEQFVENDLSNVAGFVLLSSARFFDRLSSSRVAPTTQNDSRGDRQRVLRHTCERYRQVKQVLSARGISLMVVIYCRPESIVYYRTPSAEISPTIASELAMEACLGQAGIPFINLSREFARTELPTTAFHYRHDGHWNSLGHEYGARYVATLFTP